MLCLYFMGLNLSNRQIGRVAGVLFESSDERSETGDFCFELGNLLILFGDSTVFGIGSVCQLGAEILSGNGRKQVESPKNQWRRMIKSV